MRCSDAVELVGVFLVQTLDARHGDRDLRRRRPGGKRRLLPPVDGLGWRLVAFGPMFDPSSSGEGCRDRSVVEDGSMAPASRASLESR